MTAAAIPDGLRPRLSRFVRLLASDQPGEVVAAATAIKRALAGCGADINDLGDLVERSAEWNANVEHETPRKRREARPGNVVLDAGQRARLAVALDHALDGARLSPWERQFAHSILGRLRVGHRRFTERQSETLGRLLEKIGEGSAWV